MTLKTFVGKQKIEHDSGHIQRALAAGGGDAVTGLVLRHQNKLSKAFAGASEILAERVAIQSATQQAMAQALRWLVDTDRYSTATKVEIEDGHAVVTLTVEKM